MKTILKSVLVGGLLTTFALAQQPSDDSGRRGLAYSPEHRTRQTSALAYVINVAFEFGVVDLRNTQRSAAVF
jgi:hypothetical protein